MNAILQVVFYVVLLAVIGFTYFHSLKLEDEGIGSESIHKPNQRKEKVFKVRV